MIKETMDKTVVSFVHREVQYFFATHQITCDIYLLLADRVGQHHLSKENAIIIVNTKERNENVRAVFGIVNSTTEDVSFFDINHNLGALSVSAPRPVNSERALCFIRTSLEACTQHLDCQRTTSCPPARVVDVGSNDGATTVHIYESGDEVAAYIALSHCWGGDIASRTQKGNLEKSCEGLDISNLARNFQDAIDLTRQFGVRYLWIDALCIVQDDEEDWLREAAHMFEIYNKALFVISASHSPHSETGLFFQRYACVTRNHSLSPAGFEDLQTIHSVTCDESFEENAPINQRCWTLQERIAAVAVLHIGLDGLFWECRTCNRWEGRIEKRSHPILKSMSPRLSLINSSLENQNLDLWSTIVAVYTSRQLTFRYDKFSAIAGLANMFEEQNLAKGQYLAGLWEGALDSHILWYARKRSDERKFDLAPSWSWASVDCPVGWFPRTLADFEIVDEDSCTINLENTHVYQTTKTAHRMQGDMVLNGDVVYSRLDALQSAFSSHLRFPWWTMHQPRLLDDKPPYESYSSLSILFDGPKYEKFHVLRLCSLKFLSGGQIIMREDSTISYCLLLSPVPNHFDSESSELFRRIGILQVPSDWFSKQNSENKTITIV